MKAFPSSNKNDPVPSLDEQLKVVQAENGRLRGELSDLEILYDNLMEHGVAVEDQLSERNLELERMHKRLADELTQAAKYVESILPPPLTEYPQTQWRFVPSSELGGDAFGYHWMDDDHFSIYLLDVCGHGVGAALLSVTSINVLRTGALGATDFYDPGQVLSNMNVAFDMQRHNEMYFTLWYGVFQASTRILKYASGGHPPSILVTKSEDGLVAEKLSTPQLMIGAMPDIEYESDSYEVAPNSRLFVFSDGAFEINKHEGGMLSLDDFVKYLKKLHQGSDYGLDPLIADLREIQGCEAFEDDFSLLQIDL